jgi:hypothetical protein
MARETKETFSGKLKDLTFDVFDEKVLTWCRKAFGDYYAKGLWRNTLAELEYLDKNDDDELFTLEMHCARVYDVLARKSAKEADQLNQSDRFWSKKWQLEFRQRCRERIFCHLEETCSGEATRQLRKLGIRSMKTMREYMFMKSGAG